MQATEGKPTQPIASHPHMVAVHPSAPFNLLGLDYTLEAGKLRQIEGGIIDGHVHLRSVEAAKVFRSVSSLYGTSSALTMSPLEKVDELRRILDDRVHFIAYHVAGSTNRLHDMGEGYTERVVQYYEAGSRIVKFWGAPKVHDYVAAPFGEHPLRLDAPARMATMEVAAKLGMGFMIHVADPDTWFNGAYNDSAKYGTKEQHYEILDRVLSRFSVPTILAHMGGTPENLDRLEEILSRHDHVYINCSATKWMVRELSKQPTELLRAFIERWQHRLMFGTDIVSVDGDLTALTAGYTDGKAHAFDLYASRLWALRTLLESSYTGHSPIHDPDVGPLTAEAAIPSFSPLLKGLGLSAPVLQRIYRGTALEYLKQVGVTV